MKNSICCVLALLGLSACGSSGESAPAFSMGISVPTASSAALSQSALTATPDGSGSLGIADALGNSLTITSAEVVLREIEFERAEGTMDCDDVEPMGEGEDDGEDETNDECEKFELPPMIVALPLDGSVSTAIAAAISPGTYDEVEFDIHKLEGEEDAALIAARPDFEGLSIMVQGEFNGGAFTFTSDLDEEQEIELNEPLVVAEDSTAVHVTLSLDLAAWFADEAGQLIDPGSASKDEPNEDLVKDNIKGSIEGFEDDDEDGEDDDESEEED